MSPFYLVIFNERLGIIFIDKVLDSTGLNYIMFAHNI